MSGWFCRDFCAAFHSLASVVGSEPWPESHGRCTPFVRISRDAFDTLAYGAYPTRRPLWGVKPTRKTKIRHPLIRGITNERAQKKSIWLPCHCRSSAHIHWRMQDSVGNFSFPNIPLQEGKTLTRGRALTPCASSDEVVHLCGVDGVWPIARRLYTVHDGIS